MATVACSTRLPGNVLPGEAGQEGGPLGCAANHRHRTTEPRASCAVHELADKYRVRTDWLLYNVSIDLLSADT